MDNIAGTPVEGKNFFGRRTVVYHLINLLVSWDVLLLGPRRIGKTSVCRAVLAEWREHGGLCFEVNAASCPDEQAFVRKIEEKLSKALHSSARRTVNSAKRSIAGALGKIKGVKLGGLGAEIGLDLDTSARADWIIHGNKVFSAICKREEPCLVYIDEFPIFLYEIIKKDSKNGVSRVERLLNWIRYDVRGLEEAKSIRFMISGSVGLDTLVEQHNMADTLHNLNKQKLEAFSRRKAIVMLKRLAKEYKFMLDDAAISALLDNIQWHQPYYLQRAFFTLRDVAKTKARTPVAELVDQAVWRMAEETLDNDFHHWEGRLYEQLSQANAEHAVAMLDNSCTTREGARPEFLLAMLHERMPDKSHDEAKRAFINLREILLRDAYWVAEGEGTEKRYRFQLEPLRRWWHRRHSL